VHAQVDSLSEKVSKQRQTPQVRLASIYPLAAPTRVLRETASEIVIPTRPTHTIANAADLLVLPTLGARRVRKLDATTPVTQVRSEAGWSLVARNGRPVGYVASKDITPLR
jgi:hypothetical protein